MTRVLHWLRWLSGNDPQRLSPTEWLADWMESRFTGEAWSPPPSNCGYGCPDEAGSWAVSPTCDAGGSWE